MTDRQFHNEYLSLSDALYRIAFYILESEAEAEDAVQELYLKLWKNRDVLDGIRNPKAYAVTLLRNLCLDRVRKAGRIVGGDIPESLGGSYDPDASIDQKERLEKVLAAIKSLPDRQREVLILHTIQGLTYEEISARTGINYLNLRVLLSRARQTLKRSL